LFDEAGETLLALAGGNGPVASVVLRFELAALRTLGHLPSLADCVECGRSLTAEDAGSASGRVAFGVVAGGVLCGRCRPGKKQVVSVNVATLRTLMRFANPADDTWRRSMIDRSTRGELRGVMNQYLCHLLGRQPRMHGYLGTLAG
ncbi:MAG TPA: DNA repair protein RecO C-terminal domain-containing protein, partial [Pirellulales bacterium]|jgi:DNA repair protein RecO (recombination protein O)|nr:DNA repair protein RecO C-terminal domain-containing protein [Pirellulales bacterium]